jgi:hypothetical protein
MEKALFQLAIGNPNAALALLSENGTSKDLIVLG